MALHDRIQERRDAAITRGVIVLPDAFQSIDKKRIADVLACIDLNKPDLVDAVFALLDDGPSWFSNAPRGAKFCNGASTAQVGCHIGILQRGKGKLDREGRDYWLKPLWQIGAVEKVYLHAELGMFIPGHPVAKASTSAYTLAPSFVEILRADDEAWRPHLNKWIQKEEIRKRLQFQAQLAEEARRRVDTKHSDLIEASVEYYVPKFLPDFTVIYVDDGDGDRISDEAKERLQSIGIELTLQDSMPDVLLYAAKSNSLWVIEAVTSDGEVDAHKVVQMTELARRSGKAEIGFTTVYPSWKVAAARQSQHKNLVPGTCIWIVEDPAKQLWIQAAKLD